MWRLARASPTANEKTVFRAGFGITAICPLPATAFAVPAVIIDSTFRPRRSFPPARLPSDSSVTFRILAPHAQYSNDLHNVATRKTSPGTLGLT
jgi:hypothetical protein